jgi:hypothetical protein
MTGAPGDGEPCRIHQQGPALPSGRWGVSQVAPRKHMADVPQVGQRDVAFRRAFGQVGQVIRDPGQVVEKLHARQEHHFEIVSSRIVPPSF